MAKLITKPIQLVSSINEKKPRKPRNPEVFDQDNAWKDFVTKNIYDCIAVLNPELFAAIDRSVPPEFLEQELINLLRGKYKLKGKDKKTDKLVKFRLLNGEDYYLYVHFEFQGQLEDDYSERLYIYRSLISLRYQTQNISTFSIFTGKSPSEKHKVFESICYGSHIYFRFNCYAIIDQNTEELEKSDNMFHLGVLAAKYTLDTEGDDQKRLVFKKKLYELAEKKQLPLDKIEELLSFVLDYMMLPDKMENEFQAAIPYFSQLNSEEMHATRGRLQLVEITTKMAYGKTYKELETEKNLIEAELAKKQTELAKKDAERQEALAKKDAEQQEALAKKETEQQEALAKKETEQQEALAKKETEHKSVIKALSKLGILPEKIAVILVSDLDYVLKLIEKIEAEELNEEKK